MKMMLKERFCVQNGADIREIEEPYWIELFEKWLLNEDLLQDE